MKMSSDWYLIEYYHLDGYYTCDTVIAESPVDAVRKLRENKSVKFIQQVALMVDSSEWQITEDKILSELDTIQKRLDDLLRQLPDAEDASDDEVPHHVNIANAYHEVSEALQYIMMTRDGEEA